MEFVAKSLKWYFGLSLPIRLLSGALIASIGGGSYIGFLSEFAAYNYAIYYGFRPPFEGIPYLRVSVMAISIIVSLGIAVSIIFIFLLPQLLISLFEKKGFFDRGDNIQRKDEKIRNVRIQSHRFSALLSLSSFIAGLFSLFVSFIATIWVEAPSLNFRFDDILILTSLISVPVLFFLMLYLKWLRLTMTAISIIGLIFFPLILFVPTVYAGFLRNMGYGGGNRITILKSKEAEPLADDHNSSLLIRTKDSFIVFSAPTCEDKYGRIVEISLDKVYKIAYEPRFVGDKPLLPKSTKYDPQDCKKNTSDSDK